jgi:hypothetical protein
MAWEDWWYRDDEAADPAANNQTEESSGGDAPCPWCNSYSRGLASCWTCGAINWVEAGAFYVFPLASCLFVCLMLWLT